MQVTGEDGVSQPGGSLLADVRKLLTETKGREENSVALHASVNGLIAAVQEDLRKNAEARNVLSAYEERLLDQYLIGILCSN